MNQQSLKWTPVFVAAAFALAACGGTSTPAAAPAATMAPGMVMPDGSTMGAAQPSATSASPSAPAAMVCGDEVRGDITKVLSLRTAPATSATWVEHVYTCTYRLPEGPLVLSVRESPTDAAAHSAYLADRAGLGSTVDTAGLGKYAYRT